MGEQWDLTSRVSPYLDRHMMFPLLEFLDGLITSKQIAYPAEDIQAARLALLRPTKMKDYAMDILNASTGNVENKDQQLLKPRLRYLVLKKSTMPETSVCLEKHKNHYLWNIVLRTIKRCQCPQITKPFSIVICWCLHLMSNACTMFPTAV